MSSDNTVKDVAAGATYGALNWTSDKIKEFAIKIKNGQLAFIEDPETIRNIDEQRKTPEGQILLKYLKDGNFRTLATMGLAMRKIENTNQEKLQRFISKIRNKFGLNGLHIAEFFQHGLFSTYIGVVLGSATSFADVQNILDELFKNIDKYVIFVQSKDKQSEVSKNIIIRIQANQPFSFIVAGLGSAKNKVDPVINKIKYSLNDNYDFQRDETADRITFFLKKKT